MTEQPDSHALISFGRSVWIGGAASGILSLIPFVNLLNLIFLFWLVLGGVVAVHMLLKRNPSVRTPDALICGALSGLVGSSGFSLLTLLFMFGMTQEKMEQIIARSRWLYPSIEQDLSSLFQSGRFKVTVVVVLSVFVFFSILAGAVGGFLSRQLFQGRNQPQQGGTNLDGGTP